MKKNAFTLVELLAVILILAIIALIAVPQVINLINSSKEQSNEIAIQNYVRAIETAVMNKDLDKEAKNLNGVYTIINNGKKIQSSNNIIDIDYDGKEITLGKVTIKDYKVIALGVELDNKYIIYEDGKIIYNGEKQSPVSFTSDSWETISLNVKVGNLSKYNVGDKKEVSLQPEFTNGEENSNGLYTVRIANTSTPEECSDEGFSQTACGFVIEFEDIITEYEMNPSGVYKEVQYDYGWNVDGYPASSIYNYIKNDIYNSLSKEIKEIIINTNVVSGHGFADTTNFETTDKLYLLSTKEISGSHAEGWGADVNLTRQLDYYKDVAKITTDNRAGAIKNYNGSTSYWWLRTAHIHSNNRFYSVSGTGYFFDDLASRNDGLAPAFRIG